MIHLFKNKIIYVNSNDKRHKVNSKDFLRYLREYVVLDENFTFGRLMDLLNENKTLVNYIFGKSLGFYDFDAFYKDMQNPIPEEEKNDYKTDYLEVYYVPDLWKFNKNDKWEFSPYHSFHLIKPSEDIAYSVAFMSTSHYKWHKLKINKNADFYMNDASVKHIGKYKPKFKAVIDGITLFDFIDSILCEISWHGSPATRDKRVNKLVNMKWDFENAKSISKEDSDKTLKK